VSLIALFVIALALATVAADDMSNGLVCNEFNSNDYVCITEIEVNGVSFAWDEIDQAVALSVSESVPVEVKFIALGDEDDDTRRAVTDVRMKVYLEGFKEDIEDESARFHILEGNTYVKRFTLKMPSTMDLDDLTEESVSLNIRVSARGEDSLEVWVPLEVQRDFQSLNILSVEADEVVTAGDQVAVNVVVENNGFERLDEVFVKVSVPSLGITKKVFVGDLESHRDDFDDNINDARERVVYLAIPRDAAPGNYEVTVEAYNYDASVKETARLVVRGVEARVVPPVTAKTVAPGDETTFDVVLVNPSDRMVVYTLIPQSTEGLYVEATEPLVSVNADSSRTVKIRVVTNDDVEEGTHVVMVRAISESGIAQDISFNVNVRENGEPKENGKPENGITASPTVILTVVLVIVFVVLLIILIVLLTRRQTESEELGETSYY